MRTREEIEKNVLPYKSKLYAFRESEYFALMMEVLLDIRDLLKEKL